MFNKIKQFKDLRDQAKHLQNALKEEKVELEKGGISIVMNGNQEIVFFKIDPSLMGSERKDQLERALKETTNAAIEKTKRVMAQKMQSMGGFENFGMGGK